MQGKIIFFKMTSQNSVFHNMLVSKTKRKEKLIMGENSWVHADISERVFVVKSFCISLYSSLPYHWCLFQFSRQNAYFSFIQSREYWIPTELHHKKLIRKPYTFDKMYSEQMLKKYIHAFVGYSFQCDCRIDVILLKGGYHSDPKGKKTIEKRCIDWTPQQTGNKSILDKKNQHSKCCLIDWSPRHIA